MLQRLASSHDERHYADTAQKDNFPCSERLRALLQPELYAADFLPLRVLPLSRLPALS
jgi:hypothetical protein